MFGNLGLFPIPDLDRTDFLLILGANPSVSNGSLMTAPGARHRISEIVDRGGTVVVVDPRRTETAKRASPPPLGQARRRRLPPARDAPRDLRRGARRTCPRSAPAPRSSRAIASAGSPERAAPAAGVEAEEISRLAREFAAAPSAVAYGRVGVCQQRTGTVMHWLINCLNAVTGNLDRPGGAMFPEPFVDLDARPAPGRTLRRRRLRPLHSQRVSGLPEMNGEVPVAGLADEILTPGEGQVRGMLVHAGNPVLSTPGGHRLEQALERARVDGLRRSVRDRDHAPRRRHPAAGLAARARRAATSSSRSSPCATTSASARPPCPSAMAARRTGRSSTG